MIGSIAMYFGVEIMYIALLVDSRILQCVPNTGSNRSHRQMICQLRLYIIIIEFRFDWMNIMLLLLSADTQDAIESSLFVVHKSLDCNSNFFYYWVSSLAEELLSSSKNLCIFYRDTLIKLHSLLRLSKFFGLFS